jgi:DNA polymerase elongation subunit (family B)
MDYVDIEDLRRMVRQEGCFIRWTGRLASGSFQVIVQSSDGTRRKYECDPFSWLLPHPITNRLRFEEADEGSPVIEACSPPDETVFKEARRASVFGVNIGGDCELGACKKYSSIEACTMAYDIETRMDKTREGGFALIDSDILSIACRCSCGLEFYTSTEDSSSSSEMVSKLLSSMLDHSPLWTIGWNSYNFDNECMRYHCSSELKTLFLVSRTGAFSKPTYGSIINIPGTYNVDLQLYMVKSLYKFRSFKLGDVAKDMGVTDKMKMPVMQEGVNAEELRNYNLNDCTVTLDIWKKEKIEYIIPSLALCTSSPVYDCSRYVTGTLAPLGYSSYSASRRCLIQWSTCSTLQSYSGGYVMEPVRGVHKDIFVCDFKSMYPTIMASCNINPHSFSTRPSVVGEENGAVRVTEKTTEVCIEDKVATFDNGTPSIMSQFMTFLITERDACRDSLPMYAKSIKVLSNSVYGSLGYSNSTLYSPTCAAAITAIGRHCIKLARRFFTREGLTVIYGDTDSCMVRSDGSRENTAEKARAALDKLHSYFSTTSLHMMKMEVEAHYAKGIMTDKKRYCMLRTDGSTKKVGISLSRKDVSGLCRLAATVSIEALFMENRSDTIDHIAKFISAVSSLAVGGNLTLSDVSRYAKKDGMSCYAYPHADGEIRYVPEAEAVLTGTVDCDMGKVLKSVAEEIERFTIPCRVGSVSDIMRASTVEAW